MSADWEVGERWRPVALSRGYEVSDMGRVRRGDRLLKPCRYSTGYMMVDVYYEDGTHRRSAVHALVCAAFIGPRPEGHECCHGNGVQDDNRLANLRYASRADNMKDQYVHGTRVRGDKHPASKLSYQKAAEIRARNAAGESGYSLAKEYGVNKRAVWALLHGKTWVTPPKADAFDLETINLMNPKPVEAVR